MPRWLDTLSSDLLSAFQRVDDLRQHGLRPFGVHRSRWMEAVTGDERRFVRGTARDASDVDVTRADASRLVPIDGVEGVNLGCDPSAIVAGGKRCDAPVGYRQDDHPLGATACERNGSTEQNTKFVAVLRRGATAILVVDAD